MPRPTKCSRGIFFSRPKLWLAGLLALTTLLYLVGLQGSFLFDDIPNIVQPFGGWLRGVDDWREIVFENRSGLLGRPLSLLTFFANVATTGLTVWPFKAANVVIHLACGSLIYSLAWRLLSRDRKMHPFAKSAALIVAALWLLHPIQVSTVLYVVQRMAQLSALFTLLALLFYVLGRTRLEQNCERRGLLYLFVFLPCATVTAVLSKENGALVPLLCAVVELGYFQPQRGAARPLSVKLFYLFFLLVPGVYAAYVYGLHPQRLIESYQGRLFTLEERLLSEPRALMDYMGALLLPRGPSLGVFTDDFAISRGIIDPATTLFAIIGLIFLLAAAWWSRVRTPAFFTGIGLYFAGHTMESTVFPLELYFEHRNYLPSVGFFLAVVGLAAWALPHVLQFCDNPTLARRLLGGGLAALLVLLGLGTFARASVWSSPMLLAIQSAQQHPNSVRAQLNYANMLQIQHRYLEAQQVYTRVQNMDDPAARHLGIIGSVALQCMVYGETSPQAVARIGTIAGAKLQLGEMLALETLGNFVQKHECTNLAKAQLAGLITAMVDSAPQPAALTQLWRSRFVAARLYAEAGMLEKAKEQTAFAWMTGAADPAVGVFLANLYYATGDAASGRLILADASKHIKSWDRRDLALVVAIKRQYEHDAADGHAAEAASKQ